MSLFKRLDPKTRRMAQVGNLCLAGGLVLYVFAHPSEMEANIAVHTVAGLLIGISLGMNLCVLREARRCRQKKDDSQTVA